MVLRWRIVRSVSFSEPHWYPRMDGVCHAKRAARATSDQPMKRRLPYNCTNSSTSRARLIPCTSTKEMVEVSVSRNPFHAEYAAPVPLVLARKLLFAQHFCRI